MPELKADQVLVDKARERDNIRILTNVAAKEIHAADGKVNGLSYTDRADDTEHRLDTAAVFVQIGLVPNSGFLKGHCRFDGIRRSHYQREDRDQCARHLRLR